MNKVINNSLPVTRKAHFKDALRNRWRLIFECVFMLIIGFLLIFLCFFARNLVVGSMQFNETYYVDGVLTVDGEKLLKTTELITLGSITILSFVFSVTLSGTIYIIKKICWSEGVQFFYLFKTGIKQNYKTTSLIIFAMFLLFDMNYILFLVNANFLIIAVVLAISVLILFPFLLMGLFYSSIYIVNLKQFIKNTSILTLKSYLFSLGLSILILGFLFVTFYVFNNPIILSILAIIAGLSSGFIMLMMYEYYMFIFDKYINSISHKELYRKGLY